MKAPHFLLLTLLIAACKPAAPSADSAGRPRVLSANYPLHYFATRIGGGSVEAAFPAPADEDPAFWQPADDELAAFQNAALILMNGATYSKWAEKASLPASKTVDTSAGFKDKLIEIKDAATHSHGPAGEHSHSGTAFTTWLDFQQAIRQADAVRAALSRLLPDKTADFDAAFHSLKAELESLDARLMKIGANLAKAPLLASHPVYHYWARRYGFNVESVLWEPETVPDEKAMEELKALLARHPAKWMIWEGDPATESVARLDELGLKSLVFDPCGNTPDEGDFLSVMRANVEALEKALP
ncbi:MAG TPA: zinc ABC transporter substrate-binding protein [Verrucomicrobiales bacterium]|nr:zinc ABC transporter substrate-binding protein [Verrucomicrobiales bacterium]